MTVAMASLFAFTWYICTAGSDQMAIQRFLATRDVKAARRMFNTSMVINALVMVFLSILGLALLAWFKSNPDMLAEGQTITTSADNLLLRFIIVGLPNGISGLIVAALLAAAMSSLSSGINSSCLVITVDFVERFQAADSPETEHVRLAKYISWLLGIVVVGLSFGVGMVPGNLLEVTYTLMTLPVAPLFVLFFMAMFVPWSTPCGTIVASMVSMAVAIGIGFFKLMGLGFILMMPVSLIVGVVVGMLASLIPVCKRHQ